MIEIVAACTTIALISWRTEVLSPAASLVALMMAVSIWSLNSLSWLLVLLSFMVIGFAVTKWRYQWKKERGFEEEDNGQRSVENVLGNGISPTFFAVIGFPSAFAGAVAAALADTIASEVGVFSDRSRLITTLQRIDPGTNGAVSPLGTLCSFLGASIIALISSFILSVDFLSVMAGGFLGCQFDSVLGALFERRGFLSKSTVNLIATFSGGLISFILYSL